MGRKKMKKIAKIIIFENEDEYRKEFLGVYVKNSPLSFRGIEVSFVEKDFSHVFFEPSMEGQYRFSERRAKRMSFIAAILNEEFEIELMQDTNSNNLAIFCMDLECVMYLIVRRGSGRLQLGTFFDFGKHHSKMYQKQKQNCVPIDDTQLKIIVNGGSS